MITIIPNPLVRVERVSKIPVLKTIQQKRKEKGEKESRQYGDIE